MADNEQQLGITAAMRRCIDDCSACYTAVTEALTYSLNNGAGLVDPGHIRLLIDCSEICQTTQNSMLRTSDLSPLLCSVCAEACEKCIESCERLDGEHEPIRDCIEACRSAAESCREVALGTRSLD